MCVCVRACVVLCACVHVLCVCACILCVCIVCVCACVSMHVSLYITHISNRLELLVKGDDSDPNLQMLLKLVDLLASCSEGENLFIESVCQNIMSINELLKVTSCLVRWYTHAKHM